MGGHSGRSYYIDLLLIKMAVLVIIWLEPLQNTPHCWGHLALVWSLPTIHASHLSAFGKITFSFKIGNIIDIILTLPSYIWISRSIILIIIIEKSATLLKSNYVFLQLVVTIIMNLVKEKDRIYKQNVILSS